MQINKKKSQASMEFLLLAGISFTVVVLFSTLAVTKVKEFSNLQEFELVKDAAIKLQKETMIAAAVEDGYLRSFSMPDKLQARIDYFIITQNNTITINSSLTVHTVAIPEVNGNFTKGSNKIEKINGVIHVNQ